MKHELLIAVVLLARVAYAGPSNGEPLAPAQAIEHVGEEAVVCGVVASATYASGSRGSPTFPNLDRPYLDHVVTTLIWGADRGRFDYPPEELQGEHICVAGIVSTYRGRAQIEVSSPDQIRRH